ncbi:hypothetical protein Slin15195_G122120 [Septoria linicola]|uniref:Uncharacterized protein n=1 Tax=Septoria linicola TaxID=215465 RepID=A0A9Q9ERT4_9PEZI|nr:hypothetical protein Slin14017_G078330 [Septoria linicola]USW58893.1 hypothetical protein Slin15195_G122120 [Septoria linicola]
MTSSAVGLRPVQTATYPESIWSKIPEDDFRHNLVRLEKRTNAVPIDVLTAVLGSGETSGGEHLPISVEKQVADDFAYIAAVSEGAQSVAAVCIEQHIDSDKDDATLLLKVAGMDVVEESVKFMLLEIAEALQKVAQLRQPLTTEKHKACTEILFQSIIEQHKQKLLGRLRSKKWTKPTYLGRTHKKCLWQDFDNLVHRVQHIYSKRSERKIREATAGYLKALEEAYTIFELSTIDTGLALQSLVKDTYAFCKQIEIKEYAAKLENASVTPQIGAALKTLRQLEKIGAYWRIAVDLVAAAVKYPSSFANIRVDYVQPYSSVPTEITHESWAGKCHVHAEVQLVVEYALQAHNDAANSSGSRLIKPRTVGTSKYLCYLCYLFLRYHGGFQGLSTHGRLYDQWTVPDLVEYTTETREKLANVLGQMNVHMEKQISRIQGTVWRAEPMTSRQNLLCHADEGGSKAMDAIEQELRRSGITSS